VKRCVNKSGVKVETQKRALTAIKSRTWFQVRKAAKNAWRWETRGYIYGCV